jgi:GMP synthase-like glutamine amidotransferase
MRFLVIQHIACEHPGAYEDEMLARGIAVERVEIDEGEALPDWRAFDAIIAMGGPMGARDDEPLPWLTREKALIAEAVRAGAPFWGVCLGAQLLAASLGACVDRAEHPEIGIHRDVELTCAAGRDPVFGGAPAQLTTLQWHADTFELPRGASLLASSPQCVNQAFAWRRAYGLQFHLEVSPRLASAWLSDARYAEELTHAFGAGALPALMNELGQLDRATSLARRLFGRWIENVVAPARTRAALELTR